ncbi:Rmf/CrpP fold protein [Streptomyces sp. 1331.2]|uniref:Rmf/CrpP fold protein n=1 Tax=Streptomyces sp. 1331.2 TaxID=1938835 RepID=UPI00211BEB07|nr:Rmf/CrpP fold protein [Streptomyces sp. 1331.2]
MRAVTAGRDAARAGQPVTVCPHPRESLLRLAWVRGYAAVRSFVDSGSGTVHK